MVTFNVYGWITNTSDSEMLAVLEWFRDNHGADVVEATAVGTSKEVNVQVGKSLFDDAVSLITAMKTQFSTRLQDWEVKMTQ